MIRGVVFDIGNVLITWQPERYYDALLGPDARTAFFAQTGIEAMNAEADRHGDLKAGVHDLAAQHPSHAAAIYRWFDNWLDIARPELTHSVRLLHALKSKGVPVFALSNFAADTWELARKRYPFLDLFDLAVVSGHHGLIKPDPAIYALLERETNLPPESLLFADDRMENIDGAKARRWQTHLFTDPQSWSACLVRHGVLTKQEAQ